MTTRQVLHDVDLRIDDVRDSQGRRFTEEYAQAATAQALASVGPGRPSLTGTKATSPQVTYGVTPELRARAAAEAERKGDASQTWHERHWSAISPRDDRTRAVEVTVLGEGLVGLRAALDGLTG